MRTRRPIATSSVSSLLFLLLEVERESDSILNLNSVSVRRTSTGSAFGGISGQYLENSPRSRPRCG